MVCCDVRMFHLGVGIFVFLFFGSLLVRKVAISANLSKFAIFSTLRIQKGPGDQSHEGYHARMGGMMHRVLLRVISGMWGHFLER